MRNAVWIRWVVALLLVGTAGCGGPASERLSEESADALADTLAGLIVDAYDFDRPGVLDRMVALYAESDEIVSASGGQLTVSADSVTAGIERFWQLAGSNMREARWNWHDLHVEQLAPDAAVLTGTWTIPHIAPDGLPHVLEGAWTAVFRRIGGEWKIVQEHLSAPAEAIATDR